MEAKLLDESAAIRLTVRRLSVLPEEVGLRLDRYLALHNPGAPTGLIQRWLRTGQTRVNGGRVRGGYRLTLHDEVRLPPFVSHPEPARPGVPEWAIQIMQNNLLWRDSQLLVVNKPHGMPVHSGSDQDWGAIDAIRLLLEREGSGIVPELCHRLDKETSGCLLFGLDKPVTRQLAEAFRQGQVHKEYLALVAGEPKQAMGQINQPLLKGNLRGGERVVIAGDGQSARTRYQVVERFGRCALLAVFPETGRTHQIRVHLQWLGHPVAGDAKYGDFAINRSLRQAGLSRMFLHARRIEFTHPVTGVKQSIEAPLDAILNQTLQALRT